MKFSKNKKKISFVIINNGMIKNSRRYSSKIHSSEAIVFMDLEFTGLEAQNHHIIEAACIITDKDLNIKFESVPLIINQPDEILDNMEEWPRLQHTQNGLIERCRKSHLTVEKAETYLCSFLDINIEYQKSYPFVTIAGNSIHKDKSFIDYHMKNLSRKISHRMIDVSSISVLCNRWYNLDFKNQPQKKGSHRVLDDIKDSIDQLRYFRETIFKK